ncbi:MAG: hypothetical protein LBR91_01560 [Puniceicoccales bacterium]|nr:hypothetical protein [Puniceicoccales bacterium]
MAGHPPGEAKILRMDSALRSVFLGIGQRELRNPPWIVGCWKVGHFRGPWLQ